MKIREILQKVRPCYSFEFFPPKNDEGFVQLYEAIENLKKWNPAYVSVTYGAGGSTRSKTLDLVAKIKHQVGLESMAHLTCVGHNVEELRTILDSLEKSGIENVLALRGDPPKGAEKFVRPENGFGYACELVEFIKQNYSFCLGVAGYPEGHQECPDKQKDWEHLKRKVDGGADFIVTQLFFDNRYFLEFRDRVAALGIRVPILPGIMPIINLKQTKKFTDMCGATIPKPLLSRLESVQDDPEAVRQMGIDHATEQCENLLAEGVPGIHFYTLNRSTATLAILDRLQHQINFGEINRARPIV